jgi:hypothetical protein
MEPNARVVNCNQKWELNEGIKIYVVSFISYCTFGAWVPNYVQANHVNGVLEGDSARGLNLSLAAPAGNIEAQVELLCNLIHIVSLF